MCYVHGGYEQWNLQELYSSGGDEFREAEDFIGVFLLPRKRYWDQANRGADRREETEIVQKCEELFGNLFSELPKGTETSWWIEDLESVFLCFCVFVRWNI